MEKLVIFGIGDMAELAKFYFDIDSEMDVVGFTVDSEYRKVDVFCDLPVVEWENINEVYPPTSHKLFIAISYAEMNQIREIKYNEGLEKGYSYINYISSKATVFAEQIGVNNFILEDNTIQPFVKIGNNNVIWSGNHIGHHSLIGHHNFISSQVTIAGRVCVKNNCFFGINSSIRDKVIIESFTLIGAGAWISKNTDEYGVYSIPSSKKLDSKSVEIKI